MAKIAALGAYVYQAVLALGLLLVVSNRLPSAEFTAYSLFVSIVQFTAIACFEWIRFACSRFYPGPDAQSEASERGTIAYEFLACCGFCGLGALIAWLCGVPAPVAGLGAVAAVVQGGSEIHLTMLRFRHAFRLFSWMQALRASLMAAGTLAGAWAGPDFAHVLVGMIAGYLAYVFVAVLVSRGGFGAPMRRSREAMRKHLAYGGISAGASVAAMLAPLGLKAIFTAVLGGQGAAAPLLALDLLQRPFVLIVSAIYAIRYPTLVQLFDRDSGSGAFRRELGRYYVLLAGFSMMGAAAVLSLLAFATALLIAPDLRASFLRIAPLITLTALARALVQTLLPTAAHLQRRLAAIALLAVFDSALMCLGALVATGLLGASDVAISAGATVGALIALAGGLVLLRLLPFELPRLPLVSALLALVAAWVVSIWLGGNAVMAAVAGLAATLLISLPALPRMLRWLAH